MFNAAIRTTRDQITNIAFLSISKADKKEFDACFQFQTTNLFPLTSIKFRFISSDIASIVFG